MDPAELSILVNAGGLGTVIAIILTNQNWIRKSLDEMSERVGEAHKRIDRILQKEQSHER
jgi:hypothetical protein